MPRWQLHFSLHSVFAMPVFHALRSSLSTLPRIGLATLLLASSGQLLAKDWGVTAGYGTDSTNKVGIIAGWDREQPLWQGEKWHLGLRHEVELGFWDAKYGNDIVEFGYSPVLRMIRPLGDHGKRLFVEGSIGVRLISDTSLSSDTNMSTAFQFSDMLGVGYQWGPKQLNTVGLRGVHISNAGIKKPNDGVEFGLLYYQRKF